MTQLLTTTLKSRSELSATLNELEQIGVKDKQITVLSNEKNHHEHFGVLDEDHQEETVEQGAAEAATSGGLVGAVLGGILTATTLTIPGLNVFVGGALAATLIGTGAGAMTGAVAGGLLGALGTYGVTEAEARAYEKDIRAGRILLMVKPADEAQHLEIARIIAEHDKRNMAA